MIQDRLNEPALISSCPIARPARFAECLTFWSDSIACSQIRASSRDLRTEATSLSRMRRPFQSLGKQGLLCCCSGAVFFCSIIFSVQCIYSFPPRSRASLIPTSIIDPVPAPIRNTQQHLDLSIRIEGALSSVERATFTRPSCSTKHFRAGLGLRRHSTKHSHCSILLDLFSAGFKSCIKRYQMLTGRFLSHHIDPMWASSMLLCALSSASNAHKAAIGSVSVSSYITTWNA